LFVNLSLCLQASFEFADKFSVRFLFTLGLGICIFVVVVVVVVYFVSPPHFDAKLKQLKTN